MERGRRSLNLRRLLATILLAPSSWSAGVTLEEAKRPESEAGNLVSARRFAEALPLAHYSRAVSGHG